MEEQLRNLRRLDGVVGAFVVDRAGEVIARVPAGEEAELQGSLVGALSGALAQALGHLSLGSLSETVIEAERGAVVAGGCGDGRTVVVIAQGRPNVGLIRLEVRKARRALGDAGRAAGPSPDPH